MLSCNGRGGEAGKGKTEMVGGRWKKKMERGGGGGGGKDDGWKSRTEGGYG